MNRVPCGRLRPLGPVGHTADGSVVWRCRCKCGRLRDVDQRRLAQGKVVSCGKCGWRKNRRLFGGRPLGEWARSLRQKGYSSAELAARSGVPASTIRYHWQHGL